MRSTSHKLLTNEAAFERGLIREIEFSIESIKLQLFEQLDVIKDNLTNKVAGTFRPGSKSKKNAEQLTFNTEALKNFEKSLSTEIEALRFELVEGFRPFSPSVTHTIEVPANIGFNYGANIYNQSQNMIITCPSNSHVHFYEANEFTQIKNKKRQLINSSVVQMSYWPASESYLMACAFGDIYLYNANTHYLSRVLKEGDSFILAISFIDSKHFVFSSSKTGKLYCGNINSTRATPLYSKASDAWYLYHYNEKHLLFAGLANGKIAVYDTKDKKNLKLIDSLQAHRFGKYVTVITSVNIRGKEYIISGGNDHTIKIWHLCRGKLKLLKVIQNNEDVSTIVFLEKYNMIASTHHRDYIKFFKLPFGILEATLPVGLTKARNIFLMKDKNLLGVADLTKNLIKIVQLHPTEVSGQARQTL